jgi:hypothetical protein
MRVVFHEAKPTRRLIETIQSHHQPLDLAALGEELVDLFFGRVEGEIADVESGGIFEGIFGLFLGGVVAIVISGMLPSFVL